jgi:tellurite resistance protein TehA-like permease
MNRSKSFTWIASAIFAVMAVAHIYRLIHPFDVTIASWNVPQWVSAVAAVITAVLSWMLCREARGTSGP